MLLLLFIDGIWTTLSNVIEQDDHIEIDGEIFHKPFVEKPVSAGNHDIYIYFPSSAGGGSQRLFRKVKANMNGANSPRDVINIGVEWGERKMLLLLKFSIVSPPPPPSIFKSTRKDPSFWALLMLHRLPRSSCSPDLLLHP